jgi:uncharacterized membrane protein YkgB
MMYAIDRRAVRLEAIGRGLLRYGLALLLLGSGLVKFTPDEAEFIRPLLAGSPLMGWLYNLASVQGASNLIGVVELVLAALLVVHRWWPRGAALGALASAAMFLVTVSFMFTTPDLSPAMGGFLIKDVLLFGVAVWLAGESLRAAAP